MEVTLKLEITPEQLIKILTDAGYQKRPVNRETETRFDGILYSHGDKEFFHKGEAPTTVPKQAPLIVNFKQYLRGPDDTRETPGRPSKLNDAGMKLVWDLHCQGFNPMEISRSFSKIVSHHAVRRLIQKIKEA